ncbi:hypothetical protein KJ644_04430 [Candidatus Dependentiae bacterium]|nr:hypothetical protein [Candidatus Dependentiae bacterium]MBU4387686.1 hypothetical protein [Candidatus Dependentiae bacterium]MCG2756610.1 hypothetical protein [Candidatus Dependentiae bacterium]
MKIKFILLSLLILTGSSHKKNFAMNNLESRIESINLLDTTITKIENINNQLKNIKNELNLKNLRFNALINILEDLKEKSDDIAGFDLKLYSNQIDNLLQQIQNIENLIFTKIKVLSQTDL